MFFKRKLAIKSDSKNDIYDLVSILNLVSSKKLQFYTSRTICFGKFFQVMGKISRLYKICQIAILVSRALIWGENQHQLVSFCWGLNLFDKCMWKETERDTAEILLILCKIPRKAIGTECNFREVVGYSRKLCLITDAFLNFRKVSLQLCFRNLYKFSHEKTKKTEKAIIKSPLLS